MTVATWANKRNVQKAVCCQCHYSEFNITVLIKKSDHFLGALSILKFSVDGMSSKSACCQDRVFSCLSWASLIHTHVACAPILTLGLVPCFLCHLKKYFFLFVSMCVCVRICVCAHAREWCRCLYWASDLLLELQALVSSPNADAGNCPFSARNC